MPKHARVTISKDGPYMVTGAPPLSRQTIVADREGGSERWQEEIRSPCERHTPFAGADIRTTSRSATARTQRSASTARRRRVGNRISSKQGSSRAPRCHSRMQKACAPLVASAIPTAVCGTRSHVPMNRPRGRDFCGKCNIALLAASSPGTMPPANRWSTSCRCRSAWSRIRRRNAAAPYGFAEGFPSSPPTASSMKCAIGSLCAVAVHPGTSRSATELMPRSDSVSDNRVPQGRQTYACGRPAH